MKLTDKQRIELLRVFSPRPLKSLGDDRDFFVSVDGIQKIYLAIETNENALLIGERGSGKTSFLNHLIYEYANSKNKKHNLPIQLNLLQIENFNQTTFLETLIDNISDSLKKFDSEMKFRTTGEKIRRILERSGFMIPEEGTKSFPITLKGNIAYVRKDENYENLVDILERIVRTLRDRNFHIFVMIDDSDKINSKLIWDVFRMLRETLWGLRISLIMAVLPEQVSEMTKPPLDQFFPYQVKMKSYDQIKTRELITKRAGFTKQKIELENDVLARLVTGTNGNPRSIISVMKRVLESTKEPSKITEKSIEEIASSTLSELSSIERSVLNYLTNSSPVSASSEDFYKSLGVTRSRLAQILNELRKGGLIESVKVGRKAKYYVKTKESHNNVMVAKDKKTTVSTTKSENLV